MSDDKEGISRSGSADDSVGHGEWRGITPPSSDLPVLDTRDAAEADSLEEPTPTGKPADELDPDEVAHDLSAELGLGYRDYGLGSQPKDADE